MKKKKNKGGQPTVMTKETLEILEECFLMGCTDQEACCKADIDMSTLYKYQQRNPQYVERKEALKSNPKYLARKTIHQTLKNGSLDLAQWYLLHKAPEEFAERKIQENINPDSQVLFYLPENGLGQDGFKKKLEKREQEKAQLEKPKKKK